MEQHFCSNEYDFKFMFLSFDSSQVEIRPFLWCSGARRIICGFHVDCGAVKTSIHFKDPLKLIAFCESMGVDISRLLERLERARYELAAA